MRPHAIKTQVGAAILTAMITVVMVATLSSSVLWQQWRGVEVEAAERNRTQSEWLLTGGLDWARLILREDARKGGADHLAEPWAVPLQEARMSTFLAAGSGDAQSSDATQEAFLSGQIIDLQSRLNVANLVQNGKIHQRSLMAFARLYRLFNLPEVELERMAEQLRLAQGGRAERGPDAAAILWPQDVEQLVWAGMSPRSLAILRPFITILPVPTPVNLNTAPVEVIYACVEGFSLADAHRLVSTRMASHLDSLDDAAKSSGTTDAQFNEIQHSVSSRFFEVRGSLRVDQTTVQEQSLVQRDGMDVKALWLKRGMTPAVASAE
jgi:general secretion pathway protein K